MSNAFPVPVPVMSKSPLRVGLIGAGNIWNAHKVAFKQHPEELQLTAVSDLFPAAAAKVAAEFPGARVFTDAEIMIREADIDAVLILATHDQHYPLAVAAARAGRHVLVEKPMACSLDEARKMAGAADAAGVRLMVGQCQRYERSYAGVKRLVATGELGAIQAIRFDSMQGLVANKLLPDGHWLCDGKRAGGGIVISVCVHRLDLARYLVGEVRRVSAITRTLGGGFINNAEDFACALLEFENGAIGEMFGTYAGFRMPYSEGLLILGAQGAVHAMPNNGEYQAPAVYASSQHSGPRDPNAWLAQFRGFIPVPPEETNLPDENAFVNQLLHFVECCRTGREPLSSGRDNLGTMRLIEGIYRSAQTGQWVDLATL